MVTILLYLNDWQPGDGGELRLFGTKQVDADVGTGPGLRDAASAPDLERFVDVAPLSGRVVTGGRRLQTLLWPQLALQVCARLNQHGFIRFTSGDVSVKGDLACCPRATGAALGHDLVGDGRLKGRCNLCGSERCCEVYTGVFFFSRGCRAQRHVQHSHEAIISGLFRTGLGLGRGPSTLSHIKDGYGSQMVL